MEEYLVNQIDANPSDRKKAGFKQVFLVLRKPQETFRTVAEAGHAWIYPFILVALLLLMGYILGSANLAENESLDSELGLLSEAEQNIVYIVTVIALLILGPPIYFILAYVIPSAVFMFFGNFVFERQLGFKQYLNITSFALVPTIVLAFINLIIMFITGGQDISFSPASLLPEEYQSSFLGNWLGMFSLFNIWILILLTIGLSTILEQARIRTMAWLIPLFLAFSTFSAFIFSFVSRFAHQYGSF